MGKELKFVTIFPDDRYFVWQCHMWLESLKEIGQSENTIVLIFTPKYREVNRVNFQSVMDIYPEVEFCFYKDEHDVSRLLGAYIPILRPYTAWRYWTDHPEMKDKAVFYCDCDILFMKDFNIEKFLDDDIIYCSDTNSYINASYFDSKIKDVLPDKLEEYKKRDILNELATIVGIDRQICEKNNMHSGGTQYILKNIDAHYWKKILDECIPAKTFLVNVNRQFFENENKGYQSWTMDMWLVLWNLWLRGQETKVVPEMTFAWATDNIEKLKNVGIFHNAGITATFMNGYPCFYKGKYHMGQNPMIDPHLDDVLRNEESKKHCTWYYASKLDELRNKYKLTY
jgi:hypothetical protein